MEHHDEHKGHGIASQHEAMAMEEGAGPPPPREGGHTGHEAGATLSHHEMMVKDYRKRFWVSLVLTIPILALSPTVQKLLGVGELLRFPGDTYLLLGLATAVYVYGGLPFLRGIVTELKSRQPAMMTLVAVAITVAYGYSAAVVLGLSGKFFFWELATLIDIMLLGHWIEMRSIMGASRALEQLVKLMPSVAHRMTDGEVEEVPVDQLQKGDKVLVKPGEKFPIDGEILDGETTVDESLLTGESKPVEKSKGDSVIGGSINGSGSVVVRVSKTGRDTYLSQVIDLVRAAQESKSKAQDLADRAAKYLVIIALSVGFITLVAWLNLGREAVYALERSVTVMVITCPHALGLAVPLVVAVVTAISAAKGLLIRDRTAFEEARNLDAVVFDKTGTLTEGRFGVEEVQAWEGFDEREVLRLAAAVESRSEHPIAQGILRKAAEEKIEIPGAEGFQAIRGQGATAKVEGSTVSVVGINYLRANSLDPPDGGQLSKGGRTTVYVLKDDKVIGAVALGDVVREESREAVQSLKRMGIRCMMLTGDNSQVAKSVAERLGLDEFFAEVLPDKKAEKISEIRQRGLRVAMVGDGINDAPALASADVGIAIGAGTDVAIETADVVLVRNDPRDVVNLLSLSRIFRKKMVQNLLWATGYNVVAIPLAAGVLAGSGVILTPAAGAVLMSVSTVIVAINSRLVHA